MKKNILFALFLLTLASCGKAGDKPSSATPKTEQLLVTVAVEAAAQRQVPDRIEAVGTVQSASRFAIAPQVMGRIVSLKVREGSRVSAGQVVMEIDNAEAESRVATADAALKESERAIQETEAALAAAKAREDHAAVTALRYKKLLEEKVVSPQEYESVETQSKVASAEVRRMEGSRERAAAAMEQARSARKTEHIRKGYSVVSAPAGGIVVVKKAEVGDMAMPGAPVLVMENEGRYRLEVQVAETEMDAVRPGGMPRVTFDAIPGKEFTGKVVEVVPAADPASRTFAVKIELPQASLAGLRSGSYGKALFEKGSRQALTVPVSAMTELGGIQGVFVVNEKSEATFRAIRAGRPVDGRVEVLSGIGVGERVAVSGVERLTDGVKVAVRGKE